jgi:SAM-dependent methyltransferase
VILPVPPRRRGEERIDDPALDAAVVVRSLGDVARSNALFGGRRAVLGALAPALGPAGSALTLLDVGTGMGDIPRHARRLAARRRVRLTAVGVELNFALARASQAGTDASVCADAFALPFADRSIDLVTASQLLHHFTGDALGRLLAELDRVARRLVVVGDLRRSYAAAGGFWLASRALGFHPVTQHDGVLSVFRGFTAGELAAHVRAAVPAARGLAVRHRLGWRVVASWHPAPLPADAHGAAARDPRRAAAVAAPPAAPLDRASALLR